AVFPAGGEGEGIAGGEGGAAEFCAFKNTASCVIPINNHECVYAFVIDFFGGSVEVYFRKFFY
ncbi:hypothetical protein SCB29_42035, partial [Paraburkholderia sp. SIMBA_055]